MKKLIRQSEFVCGTCKFFVQHYRKDETRYVSIGCGHCIYPKVKQRVKEQTCKYWTSIPGSGG